MSAKIACRIGHRLALRLKRKDVDASAAAGHRYDAAVRGNDLAGLSGHVRNARGKQLDAL